MGHRGRLYGGKTIREHAVELGAALETVRRWLHEGMPHEDPHRAEWVAAHRNGNRNHNLPGNPSTQELVNRRLLEEIRGRQLKNAKWEIELDQLRGSVITVDAAAAKYMTLLQILRTRFDGLGASTADRLLYLDNPAAAKSVIDTAVSDVFTEVYNHWTQMHAVPAGPKNDNGKSPKPRKRVRRQASKRTKAARTA